MKNLILTSHGNMCIEMKKSVEMIMGPQETIITLPLLLSEGPTEYLTKFSELTAELDDYMVICDLYGGTPCNALSKLLMEGKNFSLYAGMNMGMVIGFLNAQMLDKEVDIMEVGQESICNVNKELKALLKS